MMKEMMAKAAIQAHMSSSHVCAGGHASAGILPLGEYTTRIS